MEASGRLIIRRRSLRRFVVRTARRAAFGTMRAQFVRREFSVTVFIQRLQSRGSIGDFGGVDGQDPVPGPSQGHREVVTESSKRHRTFSVALQYNLALCIPYLQDRDVELTAISFNSSPSSRRGGTTALSIRQNFAATVAVPE